MLFKYIRRAITAIGITTFVAVAPVSAATISQQTPGDDFGGFGSVPVTLWNGFVVVSGDAGALRVNDGVDDFIAWCLDIATSLKLPSEYEPTDTPFSSTTGTLSATTVSNIEQLFGATYSLLDLNNPLVGASFQLALWELIYETSGSFDLTTGTFFQSQFGAVQDTIEAGANMILSMINGPILENYDFTYWETQETGINRSQNLVSVDVNIVPLPAAGLLMIGGLGGLALIRRRRKQG